MSITLYKYLEKEHAELMMEKGTVRLGTLYEFRKYDNKEIGDKNEGTKDRFTIPEGTIVATKQEDLPGAFKHLAKVSGRGILTINAEKGIVRTSVPDAYIYCCTEIFNENIMKDFGYTSCVEIINNTKFFSLIIGQLYLKGYIPKNEGFTDSCKYLGHELEYENTDSPYWLKDQCYHHQKEYRLVIPSKPSITDLQPLIIDCPGIKDYCRIKHI